METYGYSPCEYEDSPGPCYWDASAMGNGYGTSFVVHADGSVEHGPTYLPPTTETIVETYPDPLPLDALPETGAVDPVLAVTLGFVAMITISAGAMMRVIATLNR